MTKPRVDSGWPLPGQAPQLKRLDAVLRQNGESESTFRRDPTAPKPVYGGPNQTIPLWWSNEIDEHMRSRSRVKGGVPAQIELPAAESPPAAPAAPPVVGKRGRGRPRKVQSVLIGESPAE
jgi:hypothetical protein